MPHLARIRLVSVGYPDARMEDLTLDFTDGAGRPVDSTIWLRNGGGKSSILNLFFAILRPGRHEFLGARSEAKQRRLEHYVSPHAPSVVVCEWEMDNENDTMFKEPTRHLTGVFYEYASGGSSEDSRLRRLFFAAPVLREDPRLTLQGLPIFLHDSSLERKRRRTLASFRQEWTDLRAKYPHLQIFQVADIQRDWTEYLEGLGIDPEVFEYQIQMNLHEGDAQKIFQFKTSEDFANFLLKMVVDPEQHAALVSQNIEAFREHLIKRQQQLLPDQELTQGLIERLTPVVELASQRRELRRQMASVAGELQALMTHFHEQIEHSQAEQDRLRLLIEDARQANVSCAERAAAGRRECATIRLHVARRESDEATVRQAEIEGLLTEATQRLNLWRAAIPLRDAVRCEMEAQGYRQTVLSRAEQHAPLHESLATAARDYAAALRGQIDFLHRTDKQHTNRAEEAGRQAAERRRSAEEGRRVAALAEQELAHLEAWFDEAQQEQARLITLGVLRPSENGREALERIKRTQAEAEGKLELLAQEIQRIEHESARLADARSEAFERKIHTQETQKQAEQSLDEMLAEKERIEQIPILRELLETEHLDLAQLSDETLNDLTQMAHDFLDRQIALNMEKAEDERAQAHLEKRGLLPPPQDTERVLAHLKSRLRAVWSGWEYLAENLPNGERRCWIEQAPHLAAGVIVRCEDYEKARLILDKDPPRLTLPVAVTTVEAVGKMPLEGDNQSFFTVGPLGEALFCKTAGHHAFIEIQRRLAGIDDEITALQQRRRELEEALHALGTYRGSYSRSWQGTQQDAIRHLQEDVERLQQGVANLDEQLERQVIARKAIELQQESVRQEITGLVRHLDSLEQFHSRYEAIWPTREESAQIQRQTIREQQHLATILQQQAETLEFEVAEARAEALAASKQVTRYEFDLTHVDYLAGEQPAAVMGDTQTLADQYQRLKRQYELAVDEGGLLQLAERAEKLAREHREHFQSEMEGQPFTEEDVGQALQTLASKAMADGEVRKADQVRSSLFGQLGKATQTLTRAEDKLTQIEKECEELGDLPDLPTELLSAGIPQLESQERKLTHLVAEYEAAAEEHFKRAEKAGPLLRENESRGALVTKDADRLGALAISYEDLLQGVDEVLVADADWTAPEDSKQNSQRIEQIEKTLRNIRTNSGMLDQKREERVHEIQAFSRSSRFGELKGSVNRTFAEVRGEDLEPQSERWLDQLKLRLQTIQEDLAQVDTHRQILLKQLLEVATDGLRILRTAAQRSELPIHVPSMGGAHFLRIHTAEPQEYGEQLGRMADLLDQFIKEGQIPGGIDLVLASVRRLARSIRVQILHPDPDHSRHTIEIPEMSRFSGGEQLTSAVLLYCTLAQLRARQRGKNPERSSVLLLDNPIGNASRVRFLKVQRDVARAMGVQLIYTTAVNDFEALSVFPNIIRLRNNRIDRNSGRRILEADDAPLDLGGVIDGVRIGRLDQPAAAGKEQAHEA